ncbi:MAG: RsmE family RNA methyltransferase [Candidatus Brocadiia bacterium]
MHRFYVPDLGTENHVWIEGREAGHMVRVLRLGTGDEVALFDGSGIECRGVVERAERQRVKIVVRDRAMVRREPEVAVTLACSVVKAKAMDLLVAKCSEFGLRELVPVETRRSVPKLAKKEAAQVDRWHRLAVEAAKQSGRTTLTRIAPPRPLPAFLEKAPQWDTRLVFSLDEEAEPLKEALARHPRPQRLVYFVGPEGGFEQRELRDIASAGFQPVRLGRSTLRTETAAIAALAAILYHYAW